MPEADAPGMQAQRRGIYIQSLTLAQAASRQIGRIPTDRETQMRKVDADLIRAARQRPRFQQGGAIGNALLNQKPGACRQAGIRVNGSRAQLAGVAADWSVADELIRRGMTGQHDQVNLSTIRPSDL